MRPGRATPQTSLFSSWYTGFQLGLDVLTQFAKSFLALDVWYPRSSECGYACRLRRSRCRSPDRFRSQSSSASTVSTSPASSLSKYGLTSSKPRTSRSVGMKHAAVAWQLFRAFLRTCFLAFGAYSSDAERSGHRVHAVPQGDASVAAGLERRRECHRRSVTLRLSSASGCFARNTTALPTCLPVMRVRRRLRIPVVIFELLEVDAMGLGTVRPDFVPRARSGSCRCRTPRPALKVRLRVCPLSPAPSR